MKAKEGVMNIVSRTFIVLMVFFISEVEAFQFTSDFNAGIYWPSFPIGMEKYAADSNEGTLLSSLLSRAESEWENSVAKEIWSIPSGFQLGVASGNSIRWSNNFANETGFNPSTTLAVTVRYRTGTYFSRFEIILNGENQALRANLNNSLYQTILHELGHVLGLDHSNSSGAVMYASLAGVNSLSRDDQEGAVAVLDEALRRQSIGFVSDLAVSNSNEGNALACGSVSFSGSNDGNGPLGGMLTLLFSFLIAVSFQYLSKSYRNFLPLS